MIVITLSKVPPSLRGVLTKWCQEVQTGVYVGRFSARIRDSLWERIQRDIGSGEATIVFNAKNELGYQFRTTRTDREVVDYDGLPLLLRKNTNPELVQLGFSNAAKFRKAKKFARGKPPTNATKVAEGVPFVTLDIETTGLDAERDAIIAIGAVKGPSVNETEKFTTLVNPRRPLPSTVAKLTGLSAEELVANGISLSEAVQALRDFTGSLPLVGYNLRFDMGFLSAAGRETGLTSFGNQTFDLLPLVKKSSRFLDNYKLSTVLAHYQIDNEQPHHALSDATATMALADKLIKKGILTIGKR